MCLCNVGNRKFICGEIIVPKLKSFKIIDLREWILKKNKIIGIRAGEKIHEQMISKSDSYNTLEMKNFYAILNTNNDLIKQYYLKKFKAKKVKEGFEYSSNINTDFMSITDLKRKSKSMKKIIIKLLMKLLLQEEKIM